jgi:hypothetical protein
MMRGLVNYVSQQWRFNGQDVSHDHSKGSDNEIGFYCEMNDGAHRLYYRK